MERRRARLEVLCRGVSARLKQQAQARDAATLRGEAQGDTSRTCYSYTYCGYTCCGRTYYLRGVAQWCSAIAVLGKWVGGGGQKLLGCAHVAVQHRLCERRAAMFVSCIG